MVVLVPLLAAAVAPPLAIFFLFVFLSFHYPLYGAIVFCLFMVLQKWHYYSKQPNKERKPSTWSIPNAARSLRTGDPVVDELVQDDALPRVHAKYGNIVQIIKERAQKADNERHKQLFERLLTQIESVPSWVDEKKLERASQLYRDHVVLISGGLAVALVESYAFPVDAEVLFISGGLTTSPEGTVRRLMETGVWIFSILKDGMKVGSPAQSAVISVRFLHALARRKCRESKEWQRESIPVDENSPTEEMMKQIVKGRIEGEVPINQATMVATLFLFCHVCMEIAELRGADLSYDDKECYWHYWRYVGYLLGVEDALMPQSYFDGLEARKSVLYRGRQKPNEQSKILSKETIESYSNLPNIPFQKGIFLMTVRKFLGDKLCDDLGVPPASLLDAMAWYTARGFFVMGNVLSVLFPPLKAHFSSCLVQYLNNAFLHFFVLSSKKAADPSVKKACPFGF